MLTSAYLTAVVAHDKHMGISRNGQIPWRIDFDKSFFKFITYDLPIVFGRKTFDEIGKALPHRINIVLTNDFKYVKNIKKFNDLDQLEEYLHDFKDVIIAGGASVYSQFMSRIDTIIATEIDNVYQCDRFFPIISHRSWKKQVLFDNCTEDRVNYRIIRYDRKSSRL